MTTLTTGEEILTYIVTVASILFMWWVGHSTAKEKYYRQGQIDALNGKVKYRKVENEDGEITWGDIDIINKRINENNKEQM